MEKNAPNILIISIPIFVSVWNFSFFFILSVSLHLFSRCFFSFSRRVTVILRRCFDGRRSPETGVARTQRDTHRGDAMSSCADQGGPPHSTPPPPPHHPPYPPISPSNTSHSISLASCGCVHVCVCVCVCVFVYCMLSMF